MKNIVVVGAGFAGWATALFINKLFPWSQITVIGSTEIGILGAGEGTIPSIETFLDLVDIDPVELIKNCKATLKYGIMFNGWDKNGTGSYINPFRIHSLTEETHKQLDLKIDFISLFCKIHNKNIDEHTMFGGYLRNNKVFFDPNTLEKIEKSFVDSAYHFDAVETAEYLKRVAESRNIRYIDDIVTEVKQNESGDIIAIVTQNRKFETDFVFDCTGFKRLLIGQLYKTKFNDVSDKLPVNRALPFFLPPKKETEPYTTATAMNYGWCWQIPLQHRYGCGYVFDSTLCDDETAKKELQQKFGEVHIPRAFSFKAGYFEEFWKNNCIAIGLSNSFVEPLEATSIWTTTSVLILLRNFITTLQNRDQYIIDIFNQKMRESIQNIVDHLQFHYLNKRENTTFWKKVNSGPISQPMQDYMRIWEYVLPDSINKEPYQNSILGFNQISWLSVGMGIDFFNPKMIENSYKSLSPYYPHIIKNHEKRRIRIQHASDAAMSHDEYLRKIVGEEEYEMRRKLIFK